MTVLQTAALHEICPSPGNASWVRFVAEVMSLGETDAPVYWLLTSHGGEADRPWAASLPDTLLARVIFIETSKERDVLWAFEEVLRAGQASLVVAEIAALSFLASRRVQLAAEQGRATALVISRKAQAQPRPSAAHTRWHITADEQGMCLDLWGGKGFQPTKWRVSDDAKTLPVSLVSKVDGGSGRSPAHAA